MKRRLAAGAIAAAGLLASAAPAQALECKDVFSRIHQSDQLAPFVVGDSVTVPAGESLGEQGFAVDAVACRMIAGSPSRPRMLTPGTRSFAQSASVPLPAPRSSTSRPSSRRACSSSRCLKARSRVVALTKTSKSGVSRSNLTAGR